MVHEEEGYTAVVMGIETAGIHAAEFSGIPRNERVLTQDVSSAEEAGSFRFFLWALEEGLLLDFLLKRHERQRAMGVEAVAVERKADILPLKLADMMPPTWVIHGSADTMIPPTDSRKFVQALRHAGVDVEFVEVPGAEHGLDGVPSEMGYSLAVMFL